jgi:tetratricopeptide (TPR) repeat protein
VVFEKIGILNNLGSVALAREDWTQARRFYHEALDVLDEADDRKGQVYALNGLGNYYKGRGDLQRGADCYTRSLKLAQAIGDLRDQEQALGNLGTLYHQRGAWAEAEGYYRQAARICEDLGDEAGLAVWLGNLALVLGLQDREAEALPLLERQIALHRRYGNRAGEGAALLNLATHYRDGGDLEAAERYFREAAVVAEAIARPDLEARIHAAWGSVRWQQARFDAAQAMFDRALALYQAQDHPRGQLTALYKLAGMHYEREQWAAARAYAEDAWDVGRALDIPYWHGRVLWLLGEIALAQGDDQGAAYLAQAALCAQRAGDAVRYQRSERSILERVAAYGEAGDVPRALALCRTAMAVWQADPALAAEALETFAEVVAILRS